MPTYEVTVYGTWSKTYHITAASEDEQDGEGDPEEAELITCKVCDLTSRKAYAVPHPVAGWVGECCQGVITEEPSI